MKNEKVMTSDWSEAAVSNIQMLIDGAAEIYFIPQIMVNDHYFGQLEIQSYSGKKIRVNENLVNIEQGMISRDFLNGN